MAIWPAVPQIQPFWTIISRDPDQTSRFCGISISCFCWSRARSLLFSVQSMAWRATFDVITASAENRREKSPRVSWVSCFWKTLDLRSIKHFRIAWLVLIDKWYFGLARIFRFCGIYWEYRTAGHLVFWKPQPAVDMKKVLSVTNHGFVFWASRKPDTRLGDL